MFLIHQLLSSKSAVYLLVCFLMPFHSLALQKDEITVGEVITRIKDNINTGWNGGPVDTFKSGHEEQKVTGIATTFMATMEVLKKAKAQNINLIITHEPTFYNHLDDRDPLQNDPVQSAKWKYITDNNLVVWRFHDHWHTMRPDGIITGMVKKLGWEKYHLNQDLIFDLPPTTLNELSKWIGKRFNTSTVRVVGHPDMQVKKVGLVVGAHPYIAQIAMLQKNEVDVVVVGESREWETVEYVRDANELGFSKGLILMGHADSEEAGMDYCARWLSGFIQEVPINFIPAGNPLWSPKSP